MKLRKLFAVLLAIFVVLSFAGCGGGGSDDDEDDATWPVEYYMSVGGSPAPLIKAAPQTGTYKYLYFYKDGKYESGDLNNGTLNKTGEGTYIGGDPHNNVTLSLTGTFEGSTLSGESVAISSGSLTIAGKTFTAGGSSNGGNGGGSGGGDVTPPAVTWPVRYLTENLGNPGTYLFIDFYKNGTFSSGTLEGSIITSLGGGTYTGDDPHKDGSIHIEGTFGELPAVDDDFIISDGILNLFTLDWERQ